jgi:hypothetical protein
MPVIGTKLSNVFGAMLQLLTELSIDPVDEIAIVQAIPLPNPGPASPVRSVNTHDPLIIDWLHEYD